MPNTTITRRRPAVSVPFFSSPFFTPPFFSGTAFPSLTESPEDFTARANELMKSTFAGFPEFSTMEKFPALNVSEGKDDFTVTAELPGMTAKDVTVDFSEGVLTIRGEKEREETKEEDNRKFYMWERKFGSFQRALPFPGGIAEDKITAEFKDGVLKVHMPKAEEMKTTHRPIPITAK